MAIRGADIMQTLWKLSQDGSSASRTLKAIDAQLEAQVQAYIDAKAQTKGYDSANSCISYLNSSNATWKADATAMNTWTYCYSNTPTVTTTWETLQPLLPAAPW